MANEDDSLRVNQPRTLLAYLLSLVGLVGAMLYSAATTDNRMAVESALQLARPADVAQLRVYAAAGPPPAASLAGWLADLHYLTPTGMTVKQLHSYPQVGRLVLTFTPQYAAAQHLRQAQVTLQLFAAPGTMLAQRPEGHVTYQATELGRRWAALTSK